MDIIEEEFYLKEKEEKETFDAASALVESVGKLISSTAAKHARTIIIGK